MPVDRIGKENGVLLNPALGLTNPAGWTEAGLAGMGHFLFCATLRALVEMKPCFFRTAGEHFSNIFIDCGTYLPLMVFYKAFPMICKYLFELPASDEFHTV